MAVQLTDTEALNVIHAALDAQEWSADTFDIIAYALRASGRTVADLEA